MKKLYSLLAIAAIGFSANAQNLIANGGFENWTDGAPDGWYKTGITFVQSSTQKKSGNYSAGIVTPTSGNKNVNPVPDITIDVTKTYVFSGWYLDNTPDGRFKYWNQFRNSGDTGGNNMQAADYSTDSPEWVFFSAEAQPNAGATVARPGLRVYPEVGSGGTIYVDDVMFYEKGTLAVSDVNVLEKSVKMNTIVENDLTIYTPEKVTVNVYSIDGKLVSSNRVSDGDRINLAGASKGNYIVTVDNGSAKISKKIIKK